MSQYQHKICLNVKSMQLEAWLYEFGLEVCLLFFYSELRNNYNFSVAQQPESDLDLLIVGARTIRHTHTHTTQSDSSEQVINS